ncbi:MAG TPA: VWA domain-containing protein [Burkholderiales bacterium]|nr:VWA domain-containing protein [Burkholderiales bacterium]
MADVPGLTFLWPSMLWLLALVPALAALYARLLARRRALAARYANLTFAAGTGAAPDRLRRYLPPLLLFAGLCILILAVARPHGMLLVPSRQESIILAMDVSGSMRATDVQPNRLAAAQNAAKAFVAEQPRQVRIGVVAIAGAASLVQSPTDNREDIVQAIDRFQLQRGSAIGSGMLIALSTLVPDSALEVEQMMNGRNTRYVPPEPARGEDRKPAAPGSFDSAAIVLLSDGQSNIGPDPIEAAKLIAARGVRVFTVGIGTVDGTTLGFDGWSMRVRLDEDTLKRIATLTRGDYFHAANATELKSVYRQLDTRLVLERKRATEITALFVSAGMLLATIGALLSLFWFNRIL